VRVTLFHNPTAGDAQTSADQLESILTEAGYQVRYQSSQKDWRSALNDPGELAAVAGGDGTVAEIAKAFADTGVTLAVLPFGTANNIGKALGVFGDVRALVEGWRDAPTIEMDVGVVVGPFGDERFLEAVGGGVFAELVRRGKDEVDDATVMVGRETDRALQLLRRILEEAQPAAWRIELDDHDLSGAYLAVEAMNIGFAGPNVPLAAEADISDGELDLVLLREEDRERLLDYVIGRVEGGSSLMPSLDVRRGRHLRMTPPDGWPIRIDDELVGLDGPGEADGPHDRPVVDILIRPRAIRIVDTRRDDTSS
jgi:diacylglycerol kinase family enzyme